MFINDYCPASKWDICGWGDDLSDQESPGPLSELSAKIFGFAKKKLEDPYSFS